MVQPPKHAPIQRAFANRRTKRPTGFFGYAEFQENRLPLNLLCGALAPLFCPPKPDSMLK